jgi:hypothetical protein
VSVTPELLLAGSFFGRGSLSIRKSPHPCAEPLEPVSRKGYLMARTYSSGDLFNATRVDSGHAIINRAREVAVTNLFVGPANHASQ